MKILITGCCGFIGSHLSDFLSKEHTIIGIDNFSYGNISNIEGIPMEFIRGDICNTSLLKDVKADLIIHLASQKIPRYDNAYRALEENIVINRIITEKCIKDKSKLLFASTSEVYGKNKKAPLEEGDDCCFGSPNISRWSYGLSKYWMEQYIISASRQFGLDYLICRFFSVYGKNQAKGWWGGVQSAFAESIKNNLPIEIHGSGNQKRVYTYINDLCDAIKLLIDNNHLGIFNIAGNPEEEVTINELAHKMYTIKNIPENINYISYPSNYEDTDRKLPSIEKIKSIGYSPKWTLNEGLKTIL